MPSPTPPDDPRREPASLLSRLIRVPSTPGSGLDTEVSSLLCDWSAHAGVPSRIVEPVAGKGSFVASIDGTSEQRLLLLCHVDVAEADPQGWTVAPFAGAIEAGEVWGRGAVDAKGLTVVWLAALERIVSARTPLRRGITLVAASDEESGGAHGTQWLAEHVPEVRDCAAGICEGGGVVVMVRGQPFVTCQMGECGTATVVGAIERLPDRALVRIPSRSMRALRRSLEPLVGRWFAHQAARSRWVRYRLDCPIDLEVVSHAVYERRGESGHLRFPPGVDPAALADALGSGFGIPSGDLSADVSEPATESPADTPLYGVLESATRRFLPRARVVPHVTPGMSDARFLRRRGIPMYGFFPFLPADAALRQHSVDERLSIADLRRSIDAAEWVLRRFCG
ncbi:M20/M25/M40 family metallo-hydrolase [Candidatus Poribacteria bacterium]|nr:M20/M25/M40 family metallo-hydrolase [Candidatus Poribacteria bacterium]